ncbi:MAG: hypothetical protein FJZ57_00405 [Chlamydiae bacterium]|nr:hypothetical protein [Chlamydiota bacterium]
MLKFAKPTIYISSVLVASYLSADATNAQIRNLENRVSALEQRKTSTGVINPSGRPEVKNGADLFITADLLIWQAHEDGLAYVTKGNSDTLYKSKTEELNFKWDPGCRVGIGWNTPHDGWDTLLTWTYYHTKASSTTTRDEDTLYPLFESPYYNSFLTTDPYSAHGKWRLNLNLIDFELGREFFVSKWLTLRPFIGGRSAWIYQHMNANYNGYEYLPPTTTKGLGIDPITINYRYRDRNAFWGVGVRPGLGSQWGLGNGFSFYGNTAVSLLYGFFQEKQHQYCDFSSGDTVNHIKNNHSTRTSSVIVESQVGLRWETMSTNDRIHFSISAGWENFVFFGQNQFNRFVGATEETQALFFANQGDLTIQGYTLSLRLDF